MTLASALWYQVYLYAPVLAAGESSDPTNNPWLQFGILGLIIVGILYVKVIVPGWVYQAEKERVTKLEAQLAEEQEKHAAALKQKDDDLAALRTEKDNEIVRLRDLAENRTIPLLERALVLVERAEDKWEGPSQFRGGQSSRPHGSA